MANAHRHRGLRIGLATAAAAVAMIGVSGPASAATQTVSYQMSASGGGQTSSFVLQQDVDAAAPATVAAGADLTVTIDPAPNVVPDSVGGYTITDISDLTLLVPVPANATYVSATLSGGSGLGTASPQVGLEGDDVALTVPGPIAGGARYDLPKITLNLTAGESGDIDVRLGGTGADDPGFSFTTDVSAGGAPVGVATSGYPDPNPVLTTTSIG